MFEWLYKWYKGFVLINISGTGQERFLNLINAREISIWSISRFNENIQFYMYARDVKLLKEILRKTKTSIKISKRCGVPFFLFANRKRKMFIAGMLTGWFLVYTMSLYVWNISFDGNIRYTDDELMKYMKTIGIVEGIKKSNIKPDIIEKAIRNQYFDITWSSVEISGTMLKIHIRENNSQSRIEKDETISSQTNDIVANKDGVIVSMITRSGTPVVKIGTQVKKGDVLVQGKYDIVADDMSVIEEKRVQADGDIVAKVTYNISEKIDRNYAKKIYIGENINIKEISWYKGKINVALLCNNLDEKCDIICKSVPVSIGKSFYLPVLFNDVEYKKYSLVNEKYTDDELTDKANKKIEYILKKIEENTIQIIEKNVKIENSENYCLISGKITVLEYIGSVRDTYE